MRPARGMSIAEPLSPRLVWRWPGHLWRVSIGYRMAVLMLGVTVILALSSTALQMGFTYVHEKRSIISATRNVAELKAALLNNALRQGDISRAEEIVTSFRNMTGVQSAVLVRPGHPAIRAGKPPGRAAHVLELTLDAPPGVVPARLQVALGFDEVRAHLMTHLVTTLTSELAKILIVAVSLMWVFEQVAARRLRHVAGQVRDSSWRDRGALTGLTEPNRDHQDEIDLIVDALASTWGDARHAYANLEAEKQRAERLGKSLNLSKSEQADLTAALSHDLIAPVNSLQALVGELQDLSGVTGAADLRDEIYADLRKTAERMRHQIQSVVHYSKLLASSQDHRPVALESVLLDVKEELRLCYDLDPGLITWTPLTTVQGDREELRVMFRELLGNALTYRSDGRALEVRIAQLGPCPAGWAQIAISDTGRGMSEEHVEAVFGLFTRLHTYSDTPGAGMGLSLCRRIMERHGGTISLKSDLGRGTTVFLNFPTGD